VKLHLKSLYSAVIVDFETRVSQPAHCFQLKNSPGKGEVKKADPRSFSGGKY